MFSLLNFSLLAAENAEFRLFTGMPPIFGVPSELLLPVVLAVLAMVAGIYYCQSIRMPDHGWKVGLIAASFLAALSVILFWEYKLGVDLKGGAILVYEVDELETAANHPQGRSDDWQMAELMQVLSRRLNPDGLKDIVIRPFGPKQVEIVVPEVDEDEVDLLKKKITEAGVLRFLILADSETRDRVVREAAANQIEDAQTQAERLSRNVKDPTDPKGEQIIGVWCALDRVPAKPGDDKDAPRQFTFPEGVFGTLLRNGETGEIIDSSRVPANAADQVQYFHRLGIKQVEVLMVADPEIDIRGSDLASASEGIDEKGGPCIRFSMKSDSIWKMTELTTANGPQGGGAVTRKLGIVWDNKLVSAPNIQSTISHDGQITGRFTQREVRNMVELLRSGSMPVVLYKEPISDDRIGATLGLDTVKKGSQAIIISLSIVLGFVLFYYRTAGVIACFALVLNMMLTVALMFALRAPFTLPGLAGLVLTVGMSVDANVLIYERIREELEKGAALRMAIRNGFDKALITIIDSNVTTLLTAIILYIIGTDQVRGFGMTLILGIVTSMFTAVFASRAILEIGERAYRWQTLTMLKFFTQVNIDWLGLFRPMAVVSVVLIAIGLAATVFRGAGIFDIDMAGGSTVQFILDPQVHPDIKEPEVRDRLKKASQGVRDEKTKAEAVLNVYQKFLAQTSSKAGGPTLEQQIWKVDCSLENVDQLKEIVRTAFRVGDREGLQTYGLTIDQVKEIQPATTAPPAVETPATEVPATVPPKTELPKSELPETEAPKTETPKTESGEPAKSETPKADPDAPKVEAPKDEAPKTDPPKEATPAKDEPKKEENKDGASDPEAKKDDSSDCQPEDAKQPEAKADEPKAGEPKADEPKTETPATDTPKTETPKTETPKTETPKTEAAEPPKTETPPATTADPSDFVPALPPLGPLPRKSTLDGNIVKTQAELTLGNTKITGAALQDRIQAAATTAIGQATLADVKTPGWNGVDNKSFSEWTVTFALPKAEADKVLDQLNKDLSSEPVWQTSSKIGGQVSKDTRWRALLAIGGSIAVMIGYMWIRFHKISWGIAAAVALAHDALIMLGAIAVSYWLTGALGFLMVEEFKISLPVVAAFLTLIGYSVNDTIVIFDRIREIRGKSPDVTGQMVNDAVNQTLSRTFLTAGTSLMVIVILYFLGGSGIHAFAFALVIGIISGTYSTVFIASPLLVYLIGLDQQKQAKGKNIPTPSPTTTRGAA